MILFVVEVEVASKSIFGIRSETITIIRAHDIEEIFPMIY